MGGRKGVEVEGGSKSGGRKKEKGKSPDGVTG